MMLQKSAFKYLDFLGKYTSVVFSVEPRKVMVELGIAFDLTVFFDMRSAPHDVFAGIELKCVARPVESDLPISTMSVFPSVRK